MNNSVHEWSYNIHRRSDGRYITSTNAKARSEESARKQVTNRYPEDEYEITCRGRWDE